MNMTDSITSKTYDLWAKIYDRSFGALVRKRQVRALEQLVLEPGDRVLDLGVGTGLLLPKYPRNVTVVGLDISGGMLAKAAEKKRNEQLEHCHLVQGDAMLPPFAERSFDHIVITHVISVVSDPHKLLDWSARLLKPGGRIVVLNHFQSPSPFIAWFERFLNPMFVKIGWRSDLALEEVLRGSGVEMEYSFKLHSYDLWKIVVLTHRTPGSKSQAPETAAPQPSLAGGLRARLSGKKLAVDANR